MARQLRRDSLSFDSPGLIREAETNEPVCEHCQGKTTSHEARQLRALWYGEAPFEPAMTGSLPYTPQTPEIWEQASRMAHEALHAPDGASREFIEAQAERLAQHFNKCWSHHLAQEDVNALVAEGRLRELSHRWSAAEGWIARGNAQTLTASAVNRWSIASATGHDGTNALICIQSRLLKQGKTYACPHCRGSGVEPTHCTPSE